MVSTALIWPQRLGSEKRGLLPPNGWAWKRQGAMIADD
jgi:hypothetical protein